MITEIEIEGFKSLEKVRLKLGKLNLFVGANASGKSNVLDALRVLQGIGYGLTIGEIFDGKPKGAANEVWTGIRGGSVQARYHGRQSTSARGIRFIVKLMTESFPDLRYSIWISTGDGMVQEEYLRMVDKPISQEIWGAWSSTRRLMVNQRSPVSTLQDRRSLPIKFGLSGGSERACRR